MTSFVETITKALADAARAESAMRNGELRQVLRTDPALALSRFATAA